MFIVKSGASTQLTKTNDSIYFVKIAIFSHEKQISRPQGREICFFIKRGVIRTGRERSERNMPGACFSRPRACRSGARARRSSPSPP